MYLLCQRDGGGYHKSSSSREGLLSVDDVARVMRRMRGWGGGYSDVAGEFDLVCRGVQRSSKSECKKRKQVSTEQGKEAT